jgi:hypothetical protein
MEYLYDLFKRVERMDLLKRVLPRGVDIRAALAREPELMNISDQRILFTFPKVTLPCRYLF